MPAAPYDTVNTILNSARVRLNDEVDSLVPLGGQLLDNSQAFTQQLVNTAWRKMQRYLTSLGFLRFEDQAIISGLPALAVTDPGVQTYVSWAGFYNGQTLDPTYFLPQNLMEPLDVWERESGTSPGTFLDMDNIKGALPAIPKQDYNQLWQWRADAIYMPGSNTNTDLRVSFLSYLDDFADTGTTTLATGWTPWFNQPVPIVRCQECFTDYICAEVAAARENGAAAIAYTEAGQESARQMAGADFAASKDTYKASEYGKMRDAYTPKGGQ